MDNQNGGFRGSSNNNLHNRNNGGYNNPRNGECGDAVGGHFNASHRSDGGGHQSKDWNDNSNGFGLDNHGSKRGGYGNGKEMVYYKGELITRRMMRRRITQASRERKDRRLAFKNTYPKNEAQQQNDSFNNFRDPYCHPSTAHPQMPSRLYFLENRTPEPLPDEAMTSNNTLDNGISTETRKLSEYDISMNSASTNPVAELDKTDKPRIRTPEVNVVKIKQEKDSPALHRRIYFLENRTPEPLPAEAMTSNNTLDNGISTDTRKLSEYDMSTNSTSANPVAELERTDKSGIRTLEVNVVKIKQEKDSSAKPVPKKLTESSEDESSSSDDSYEAGEVRPVGVAKTKTETNTIQPSKSKHSSSEEESSSDDSETPIKSKTDAKEISTKKSRKLRKLSSERDVVCMGSQERKYTIPDEDSEDSKEDESETVTKSKSEHETADKCIICDKMGHTSYHCQMICKNCLAPHHSFKNCPQPPNLNIAVQTFMDFTMKQFSSLNVDPRFVLPAGLVPAPTILPAASPSKADKLKKKKRPLKKTNKKVNKKIKVGSPNSDDDDDALTSSSSESSDEDSSEESTEEINKSMRKRIKKNSNLQKVPASTATPHFPFPMLAAPYNSLMYPYGAQFKFPN